MRVSGISGHHIDHFDLSNCSCLDLLLDPFKVVMIPSVVIDSSHFSTLLVFISQISQFLHFGEFQSTRLFSEEMLSVLESSNVGRIMSVSGSSTDDHIQLFVFNDMSVVITPLTGLYSEFRMDSFFIFRE